MLTRLQRTDLPIIEGSDKRTNTMTQSLTCDLWAFRGRRNPPFFRGANRLASYRRACHHAGRGAASRRPRIRKRSSYDPQTDPRRQTLTVAGEKVKFMHIAQIRVVSALGTEKSELRLQNIFPVLM